MRKLRVDKYEITSSGADSTEIAENISRAHAEILKISNVLLVDVYEDPKLGNKKNKSTTPALEPLKPQAVDK